MLLPVAAAGLVLAAARAAKTRGRCRGADVDRFAYTLKTGGFPAPAPEPLRSRVQLATIRPAERDRGRFRRAVQDAERDWRDALARSGLGGEDGPSAPASEGYMVPR